MNQFPAVVIGGPPHSGKSVLTYGLTQALRRQQIDHYVLRACPDGEGDWSNEAPPELVRLLRNKGQFTSAFVEQVCRDLARRHLPLLVDVGGRPTPEQETIFDHCTHAILIAAQETDLHTWRNYATAHGLTILAELQSSLTEPEFISAEFPILRGRITGLERYTTPQGQLFDHLTNRLKALFALEPTQLRTHHLAAAPAEITVELDRLAKTLGLADNQPWHPSHISLILEYLPQATPLAIYGRGPGWLYAALARHTQPAPLYQFDARLGWVEPLPLIIKPAPPPNALRFHTQPGPDYTLLTIQLVTSYLDYSEGNDLAIPQLPLNQGVVISGKLPHWLLTSLVIAYQNARWIGVYQPTLGQNAVIVASHSAPYRLGDIHPLTEISNRNEL